MAVRVAGVALVVALAGLLALRIYGDRRLAAAKRAFAAKAGQGAGNPYASPIVPDRENAAILLRAGAEAMVITGNERAQAGEMTMTPVEAWTPEQRDFLHRYLESNGPALELLHRAAAMTRSSFGLRDPVNEVEELRVRLPLLKLLTAQRLLLLDARTALLTDNRERFLADARSMATMAVAIERESPTIAVIIGLAAEKIFLTAASEATARPDAPVETVRSLQALVPDNDLRAVWRRTVETDAFAIDRRVAAGHARPGMAAEEGSGWRASLLQLCCGDIFNAQVWKLRAELLDVVDQPLGSSPAWADRGKASPRSIFPVFELVMFPELARAGGRVESTMSLRNLGNVALKVRLRGLETGAYPQTLADYPEAQRADPFAARPLSYLRRPDGSAVIAVADFGLLWSRISDAGVRGQPFTWELPAPGKAVAKQ